MATPTQIVIDMNDRQNRHRDAVQIDEGACNPIAISRALVRAVEQCRAENFGTDEINADPAIRLIVHQLAHLTGILNFTDYMDARTACEAKQ